jgi:leucyl aminopeptidase
LIHGGKQIRFYKKKKKKKKKKKDKNRKQPSKKLRIPRKIADKKQLNFQESSRDLKRIERNVCKPIKFSTANPVIIPNSDAKITNGMKISSLPKP